MTVIHSHVFDPTNSLFKMPASERATHRVISCEQSGCPLLAKGQCQLVGNLFGSRCPYGKERVETGPTRRSKKFFSWIKEKKEQYPGKALQRCDSKMVRIGEYVYLPYPHLNLCKSITFARSATNSSFIHQNHWTVENTLKLIDFRPQALFGGEIRGYQKKEVPKLLLHLRECDPDMWQQVIAARPELDVEVNHVGRVARLVTLVSPVTWTTGKTFPVTYTWDGEKVTTSSLNALSLLAEVKAKAVSIIIEPDEKTTIKVLDNGWVGTGTEFVD